jgi:hypothetical protein
MTTGGRAALGKREGLRFTGADSASPAADAAGRTHRLPITSGPSDPGVSADRELHECAGCEAVIYGEPYIDPEQKAWLGDDAPTWCDPDCMADAGEQAQAGTPG